MTRAVTLKEINIKNKDEFTIMGIDPGAGGAIAVLRGDGKRVATFRMPVSQKMINNKVRRRRIVTQQVVHIVNQFKNVKKVYMERVHSHPNDGVVGAFAFGESFGILKGVLYALDKDVVLVLPQIWKKAFGLLGKSKAGSRDKFDEIFGKNTEMTTDEKEAALIALYGLMDQKGQKNEGVK